MYFWTQLKKNKGNQSSDNCERKRVNSKKSHKKVRWCRIKKIRLLQNVDVFDNLLLLVAERFRVGCFLVELK